MNLSLRKFLPLLIASSISLALFLLTVSGANAAKTTEGFISTELQQSIQGFLWSFVTGFLGWLVGIGGLLLDYGIGMFVVGFGDVFLNEGVGVAVNEIWVSVRDIFNLTFIFGLVWIGFRLILNSSDSNTRTWLIHLILAALLVNFSLFFTKFIVDFSNMLATEIVMSGFGSTDVSAIFMQIVGLNSVFGSVTTANLTAGMIDGSNAGWGYIFGTAILFLIAAFVFAAGGLLLIIRFIALSLYMVLSPLMFLGWVFPNLQGITSKYWRGFLGRAFYAPVYILLIFFAGTIVSNLQASMLGGADFMNGIAGSGGEIQDNFSRTFIPFILACGFLIGSIVIGKKMSDDGGSAVISAGKNVGRRVQRVTKDIAGSRVARTIARPVAAGAGLAARNRSYKIGNKLEKQIERMQYADKKTTGGRIASAIGGTVIADRALRGGAKKLKEKKYGLSTTIDEDEKRKANIEARVATNQRIERGVAASDPAFNSIDRDKIYDPKSEKLVDKNTLSPEALEAAEKLQAEREKEKADYISAINSMTAKDLEAYRKAQPELFDKMIGSLNDSGFEKIMSNDDINPDVKNDVATKRQTALKETLTENGVKIASQFEKLTNKQLELLGDEFIQDNAEMFNQKQWDNLEKSEKFTPNQKDTQKIKRGARIESIVAGGDKDEIASLYQPVTGTIESTDPKTKKVTVTRRFKPDTYKKPSEIASLPFKVLNDGQVAPKLPVDAVKQIGRDVKSGKSHLSSTQVDELYQTLSTIGDQRVRDYLGTVEAQKNFKAKG